MNADDHRVEEVLRDPRRFMVPLYQRKYQWAENRLSPFWEDVLAKAVEVVSNESRFQHYLGALILAPIGEGAQIGVTPQVQVVDGQQRLTTFQILLAAIREAARDCDRPDVIRNAEDYIFNPRKGKDTDPLTRFKLTPTPSDRQLLHDILEKDCVEVRKAYSKFYWGGRVPKNCPLKALWAYEFFKSKVDDFVLWGPVDTEAEPEDVEHQEDGERPEVDVVEARLEALLKALLNRMKLVVITLGEDDDAQVIFETLNSQGEPLRAMDLVRNNIFHRLEKQGFSAEDLYKELWDPFDDNWWREAAPNARPRRPRMDHFLSHVLAAETGERISMRELYAEYRAFAVPKGGPRYASAEDELRLLKNHEPTYLTLEGREAHDPAISWLGRKLAVWQVTTAYPIAFQISADGVEREVRLQISKLIYSYIVRRALCGLTAKNLNQVFQGISQKFLVSRASLASLKEFFVERKGDSTRFPSNEELRQGILSKPAYLNASGTRLKDVLWELERASRSRFSEDVEMPLGLQVEHVLPRSWTEHWPSRDGEVPERWSDDPRSIKRSQLIDTLGNLTLVTGGLNVSASNKGFIEKREKYATHTALHLNKWFLGVGEWHEEKILERGEALSEMAKEIWVEL